LWITLRLGTKAETLTARRRRVLPLSEIRVGFTVECSGLQDAERGATDVDHADLDRATYEAALIENGPCCTAGRTRGSPESPKPVRIPRCLWATVPMLTRML
jgi:Encapsulating protein for peroxidase